MANHPNVHHLRGTLRYLDRNFARDQERAVWVGEVKVLGDKARESRAERECRPVRLVPLAVPELDVRSVHPHSDLIQALIERMAWSLACANHTRPVSGPNLRTPRASARMAAGTAVYCGASGLFG